MVRKRLFDTKAFDHRPTAYLDIKFNVNQICELVTSAKYLTKQRIMSFAGGNGATMKLAKWKLDSLGYIKSFSGVHNEPDRLRRLTQNLELSQSLASIYNAAVN